MKTLSSKNLYNKIMEIGLVIILIVMPFHAFLSIVTAQFLSTGALLQSWKEVLVLLLVGVWALWCISKRQLLLKLNDVNIVFLLIIGLSLLVTLFVHPDKTAVLFGIKTNIVAIVLFLIAQAPFDKKQFIRKNILWLVIGPAILVTALALAQSFIIPPSWLIKIGYNLTTINPTQIIDSALKFYRAFSTLGGPNQLGAYLIVPISFAIVYAIRNKQIWLGFIALLLGTALFVTYSRSAWVGALAAVITALIIVLKGKLRVGFLLALVGIAFVGALYLPRVLTGPNSTLQYILLHGRVLERVLEGSDVDRLESFTNTTDMIVKQPFGHGLGSAGPASFKAQTPVIPENWYLQIAYETGVIGLILYIIAFGLLLGDFLRNRKDPLAASLFAATVGILVANLFLHAWADSTLALVVFCLYGLYRGQRA